MEKRLIAALIILTISFVFISGCELPEEGNEETFEEPEIERHVSLIGGGEIEKTELCGFIDGVVTNFAVYDKDGNCAWINGHAKFTLKDDAGNKVYEEEMDFTENDLAIASDCLVGPIELITGVDKLDNLDTIEVIYEAVNGKTYADSGPIDPPYDYCY